MAFKKAFLVIATLAILCGFASAQLQGTLTYSNECQGIANATALPAANYIDSKNQLHNGLCPFLPLPPAFGGQPALVSTVNQTTVIIPPSVVQQMNNTTGFVTLVNPPGSGKMIIVDSIYVNLQFPASGGVAYATGTGSFNLFFFGGDTPIGVVFTSAQIKSSLSIVQFTPSPAFAYTFLTGPSDANGALLMGSSTGVLYTAGNSNIVVTTNFHIIQACAVPTASNGACVN